VPDHRPHITAAFQPRGNARLALLAAIAAMTAHTPIPAFANSAAPGFTDPATIDRAVADFTGATIGEIGGARAATDPRLRLTQCAVPLSVNWHGTNRSMLAVECRASESWRIFVSVRQQQGAPARAPAISRGDPVTVMVRGRGFSVQQSGEAMEAGRVGDWISIRTARRSDPVRARIERPGLAVIAAQ